VEPTTIPPPIPRDRMVEGTDGRFDANRTA